MWLLFRYLNLDMLCVNSYAPGDSPYNAVERVMATLSLGLAGVVLPVNYFGSHLDGSQSEFICNAITTSVAALTIRTCRTRVLLYRSVFYIVACWSGNHRNCSGLTLGSQRVAESLNKLSYCMLRAKGSCCTVCICRGDRRRGAREEEPRESRRIRSPAPCRQEESCRIPDPGH